VTVELDTVRKYRQQIQKGVLTRDLQVTIYRRSERDKVVKAGSIPELATIFDEVLGGLAPSQVVDASSLESANVSTSGTQEAHADLPAPEDDALALAKPPVVVLENEPAGTGPKDEAPSPEPAKVDSKAKEGGDSTGGKAVDQITTQASPPGKGMKRKRFSRFLLIGVGLLAVLALSQMLKPGRAVTETDYVSRTTKVRSDPGATGAEVGEVARGDQLVGRIVKGAGGSSRWLQITKGEWKGDYVWTENLSHYPRPALASTEHRIRRVKSTSMMWTQPNSGSQTIRSVEPGERMVVLGKTADGWREIELNVGGVGYLPPAAFGRSETPATPESAATTKPLSPPPTAPAAAAALPALPPPAVLPPARTPAPPAYIAAAPWLKRPATADQIRLAPARAIDQNQNGRATVDCAINYAGLLTDCSVVEDPIGWGFGQAALELARLYQAAPTTNDGQPTAGSRVKITFRFAFQQ